MTNKIETSLLLDYYGTMLTDRQREVMRMYCDMDLSLSEVSEELSITRQAALDLITRSTEKLNYYEDKLGLVQKIQKIALSLQKIIDNTDEETVKDHLNKLLTDIKEI